MAILQILAVVLVATGLLTLIGDPTQPTTRIFKTRRATVATKNK